MRPQSSAPRRLLTLALALLLCGALAALHHARSGSGDPVSGTVRDAALVPGQTLTLRVQQWWTAHVSALGNGPRLARENAQLKAQVHALSVQARDADAAQTENARLRALLDFEAKTSRPLLAAEVLAVKPLPQADTLTLSRGRANGVRPQQIALAADGTLVGQVLDVSARSCSVLLLSDGNSSVSAQAGRPVLLPTDRLVSPAGRRSVKTLGPVGLCQGDRTGLLLLTDLPPQADVLPGDIVTTSGLGGIFPKGLKIGVVSSVTTDRTRSVKTCRVRPSADFDHLEDAWLLQ